MEGMVGCNERYGWNAWMMKQEGHTKKAHGQHPLDFQPRQTSDVLAMDSASFRWLSSASFSRSKVVNLNYWKKGSFLFFLIYYACYTL